MSAFAVLGIVHWIGAFAILVGYLLAMRTGVPGPVMIWAARIQLLLGGLMFAFATIDGTRLRIGWLSAKLVLAVAVVLLIETAVSRAREGHRDVRLLHAGGILTILTIGLASAWR